MAGLVRETSFGSSTFGFNLGKDEVKLVVAAQIVGESTRCTIVLF